MNPFLNGGRRVRGPERGPVEKWCVRAAVAGTIVGFGLLYSNSGLALIPTLVAVTAMVVAMVLQHFRIRRWRR